MRKLRNAASLTALCFLALFVLALFVLAGGAAAETQRVEAVGAVAVLAEGGGGTSPRDAALERGLFEAVRRVASGMVTAGTAPDQDVLPEDLALEILGDQPRDYVTRFRILEDRGERPALFVEDPEVEVEYVVVAEVHVDAERVRRRLAEHGMLAAPAGQAPLTALRVTVRGVESWEAFQAAREAVETAAGDERARLVEAAHGSGVLEVETEGGAPELLNALLRQDRPGLTFSPVAAGDTTLEVAVEWAPPAPEDDSGPVPGEIDTPARKRY